MIVLILVILALLAAPGVAACMLSSRCSRMEERRMMALDTDDSPADIPVRR